ncbi:MAG: flagellar basal-body MS-ring/collar protein FliF [Actinomycetota bacterium]
MPKIDFQAIGQNILASIQRMTGPQRVTLALAFFATLMSVFLVANATGNSPMSVLMADLEPETAAAVVTELDARGVPYELEGGGRIVEVPSDQVHQLRIELAALNLPGSADGWDLLENQGITSTAAEFDVAVQRALQGELARTISAIEGVSSANVHLVMPERDILSDDGRQASASILLATGGSDLRPTQVNAIVNLVAASVEGLSADQVAVTNDAGEVLAAPGDAGGFDIEGDAQFRQRRQFESSIETRLETLLTTLTGIGGAQVTVTADLDFDSVMTTSETHTPIQAEGGGQLLDRDTVLNEVYRGEDVAADEEGQLEVELPEDALGDDEVGDFDEGVQYGRDERDRDYVVDRVVTEAAVAPGAIRSLSVGVLLDEEAIDAARLPEIEEQVTAAAGIRPDRGDTLAVSLLPINEDIKAALAAQQEAQADAASAGSGLDLVGLLRTVGTIIIAVAALIFGLKYISRGPRREVVESIDLTEVTAGQAAAELGAGDGTADAGDAEDEASQPRIDPEEQKELEEMAKAAEEQLHDLIANQTDDVADVLRTWLSDAGGVPR